MALSYSIAQQTYGVVEEFMLPALDISEQDVSNLLAVCLWEPCEGGYVFHDWDEHQTSRAHAESVSKTRAEAGRRGGKRSGKRDVSEAAGKPVTSTNKQNASNLLSKTQAGPKQTASNRQAKAQAEVEVEVEVEVEKETPLPPTGGKHMRYPPEFESWWAAYPNRSDKRRAFPAWQRARKRATDAELIAGAERYAADPNRSEQFTKLPATWLNADAWLNGPLPGRESRSNVASALSAVEAYAALEIPMIGGPQ